MLIGELADRCGVSARALRYYEEQGLLVPGRTANGYRAYDEDAPVVVARIRALLDAGLGTGTIGAVLPCARGTLPELHLCPDLTATIERTLAEIDRRIDGLDRNRTALRGLIADGVTA